MNKLISKQILDIYDKYEGDFGLLDEPWASKKDKKLVSVEASMLLGEYVDKLHSIKNVHLSNEFRKNEMTRLNYLESFIEDDVVNVLKARFLSSCNSKNKG